jgi:hypothetical protein
MAEILEVLVLPMEGLEVSAADPVDLRFRPGKSTKRAEEFDKAILYSRRVPSVHVP